MGLGKHHKLKVFVYGISNCNDNCRDMELHKGLTIEGGIDLIAIMQLLRLYYPSSLHATFDWIISLYPQNVSSTFLASRYDSHTKFDSDLFKPYANTYAYLTLGQRITCSSQDVLNMCIAVD